MVRGLLGAGAIAHRLGVDDHHRRVPAISGEVAEHGDLARVGHAARLHHDVRGRIGTVAQQRQLADEVAGDAAADAAVRQADHLPLARLHELGIDVDRAEVVDEHGEPPVAGVAQQRVEQRRLARAEKAADHGQRDRLA